MKCRYCVNEAVYPDGLCERCHRAEAEARGATVMSEEERDNFKGKTINEDGSTYNTNEREDETSRIHVYVSNGMPLRIKLAIGFIVFCLLAIVVSALGFLILALPYLVAAGVVYVAYSVIKAILKSRH